MAITVGKRDLLTRLRALASALPDQIATALYQEMEIEGTEMKRRTPVLTGTLRGSIRVEPPVRSGNRVSVTVVAGGPAAPYAVMVHENLDAFHKVGQAKFMESVLYESAPHLGARVARRIDLGRAVGKAGG